jgi:cytochrome c oxidase assembly protein subunit 11
MAKRSNATLAFGLVGVIGAMGGLAFASVPLYRMFCAATGYGGTPQIGPQAGPGATDTFITVRFNADVNGGMPWRFEPLQRELRVALGDSHPAFYQARNLSGKPVTGVSTYNVTPEKAAQYFHKTQCFCFNEQTIAAGGEAQFPLEFWVDPAIATDPHTKDVKYITLSYTFFHSLNDASRTGALAKAGPHIGNPDAQRPTATP